MIKLLEKVSIFAILTFLIGVFPFLLSFLTDYPCWGEHHFGLFAILTGILAFIHTRIKSLKGNILTTIGVILGIVKLYFFNLPLMSTKQLLVSSRPKSKMNIYNRL